MCTKNEQLLASVLESVLDHCCENITGDDPAYADGGWLSNAYNIVNAILSEDISAKTEGKKSDERYYYTGVDALKMTQAERDKLGVCEFTVRYGAKDGELVLRAYWDSTLRWIMQPSEDGQSFTPSVQRKFPGDAYARSFLKKLADEEVKEPGTFAKKYYKTRPTVYVRKTQETQE